MWTHWHMSVHDGSSVLYCRRNGQWVADSAESTAWDREKDRVIETIQARRRDSMVVVRTRVVPDST